MLTDFGLAHPDINPPNRQRQIKSLPDNESAKLPSKQNSSNHDLNDPNVRYLKIITVQKKKNNNILKIILG